jgi:hypothetical protein
VRFTVYDLNHGVKKVASITEPALSATTGPDMGWGQVITTCGTKMLLHWPAIAENYSSAGGSLADFAVLDLATGHVTSPPVSVPSYEFESLHTQLQAATDADCSATLLSGVVGTSRTVRLAVGWAHGQALWQQLGPVPFPDPGPQTGFQPLAAHDGVAYGLLSSSSAVHPGSIGLADGKPRAAGTSLAPIAFTADGSPLFLQFDPGTAIKPTPATPWSPSFKGQPSPPSFTSPPALYPVTVWVGTTTG